MIPRSSSLRQTWGVGSWAGCGSHMKPLGISDQVHSVEAAHLTHTAGKLIGAFNDAVLTVQRRRGGGRQAVQVIHQQAAVGLAARPSWRGRSRGGERRQVSP